MSVESIALSLRAARAQAIEASFRGLPPRLGRVDLLCVLALALAGIAASAWGFAQFDSRFYEEVGFNIWFQADQPRTLSNMTLRDAASWWHSHYRTTVHPIFSLLFFPPTRALMALGLPPLDAARLLVVLAAGLTLPLFYIGLRGLGLAVLAALAFAAALLSSAAFIHWFTVVDSYAFGALTICLMLAVLAWWRGPGNLPWILASAATLAVTVTNWGFGLAAAFFRLPFRRFLVVSGAALVLVAGLAVVQQRIFPSARLFFLPYNLLKEGQFTQVHEEVQGTGQWTPLANLRVMLLYGAVTPPPKLERLPEAGKLFNVVSNQNVGLTGHDLAGAAATALWVGLFGLGLWGAATAGRRDAALALGAFGAGQIGLHLVYGQITFLYAANFFPALLGLAAFGALTPARRIVVGAAMAFVLLGGYNNYLQFMNAAALVNGVIAPR